MIGKSGLIVLRVPEDKPDAAKKHLAALEQIIEIMNSEVLPYDSKDLCVALVNQLLIMVNHFNQEVYSVFIICVNNSWSLCRDLKRRSVRRLVH